MEMICAPTRAPATLTDLTCELCESSARVCGYSPVDEHERRTVRCHTHADSDAGFVPVREW
jgi:hypothetical protein